ncbi:MAG: hypothetical protein ACK5LC_07330 [Coprobacillaceae bacterium]
MDDLLPDIDPKTYTGTAVAAGYVLTELLNVNEQLALANWLELVADILETNVEWIGLMKLQEEKIKTAMEKAEGKTDASSSTEKEELNTAELYELIVQMKSDLTHIKNNM